MTDANVVLGYIGGDAALGGELSLDADAAREALAALAEEAGLDSALAAAEGVYRVANAAMTRAVRAVTVERGRDPRNFALVAFGGAGPLHAAALADRLDVETVLVPLASGVLSAHGLLGADERYDAARTHRTLLDEADADDVEAVYSELAADALADADAAEATVARSADLRYAGQSFELGVDADAPADVSALRERFHRAHERAYGYRADEPVELVTLRASATVERSLPAVAYEGGDGDPRTTREACFDGAIREAAVYDRRSLPPGAEVAGPAILESAESTTLVPPSWRAAVGGDGALVLEAEGDGDA